MVNKTISKSKTTDPAKQAARDYFDKVESGLDGLDKFLGQEHSPLYQHDLIGNIIAGYLGRLRNSFQAWDNRLTFTNRFRIQQAESGYPVFQSVLDLDIDRGAAKSRLAAMPDNDTLRQEMVDFILRKKAFPEASKRMLAERSYLEQLRHKALFSAFVLPKTVRVSVNPKTGRPYYVVHWAAFDGIANLPMVYLATIEDSSEDIAKLLIGKSGNLSKRIDIPLPVDGLLNSALAHKFDDFCENNSSYSLTLSTIASNLDVDFDHLHPKQLRRYVLGPFYSAGVTSHGQVVEKILAKVRKKQNSWMLTWTEQEIFSISEKPAKWGLWGGEPSREAFHINTDDLESARQGVSSFQRHALVPHDAYQALYASNQQNDIFDGYKTHIISGGQVISDV